MIRFGEKARLHFQNLNDKPGGRQGWALVHGRAWLSINTVEWVFRLEWLLKSRFCMANIQFEGDEESIQLSIGIPPVAIWLSITVPCKSRLRKWLPQGKECGVDIHDWTIWIKPWTDMNQWASKDPWWKKGITLHILDILFGKHQYESRTLKEGKILVPMPEKSYGGTLKLTEDSWIRPRGITRRILRAHIDMDEMIPFPGKGENSWDCGEDGMHGMTCQAGDEASAIAACVESVTRSRYRHGGPYWRPSGDMRHVA